MAARIGDLELATRLLNSDPNCVAARIHEPGYAPVPPLHIYCWTLGFGRSPHDIAIKFGHREVLDLLVSRSPARIRLLNALMSADGQATNALLAQEPTLLRDLSREDHSRLAIAIFFEHFEAADLMLRVGFDPTAPGVDGGTALHAACWVGNARLVEGVLARQAIPLDARDPTHKSTPLGWTAFGSVNRHARDADYPAVAERLVAAGADITALANGQGRTLLQMAQGNKDMQEALRRLGAT
jgi:ankyrin repeat protein